MRYWSAFPLLAALALGACERAPELQESEVVAIGDSAATVLTNTLMSRARTELETRGPARAIEFCSEAALPMTAAVQDALDRGLELKRTSSKIRNPANAPDSLERVALAYFEEKLAAGEPLARHFVQKTSDGWRYYRPIVVADFCTACHGPRDRIHPAVQQILDERYPNDQATGYSPGDFRGVIRVSIPPSAGSR